VHYPIPVHKQQAYKTYAGIKLPVAERLAEMVISLPISPVMTDADVEQVICAVNSYSE